MAVERKLAAILSADIAAYSRLMGEDEERTLHDLNAARALVDQLVSPARGRVFSAAGDSVLAEFPSVVDAVQCGAALQAELTRRYADVPEGRRMRFRIGINLGDVMVNGDNLYGDGVNVAARIQTLAEPGGICISGSVHEQVRNKVKVAFQGLGLQAVKNIAEPVHVYRARLGSEAPDNSPSLIGAAADSVLPHKPSIAVLPFDAFGGDGQLDAFADGLTEDIITELSRFSEYVVVARNSVFTYKGKPAIVQRVGRELNVRYVLEGSARRSGQRVRISAQLIDALSGRHLWAERFDRAFDDPFALQDSVCRQIVATLAARVSEAERLRARNDDGTMNLEAYDLAQRGREAWLRFTPEDNLHARALYEQAIARDPEYARAYGGLAWTYLMEYGEDWGDRATAYAEALRHARAAVRISPSSHSSHLTLGQVYLLGGMLDEGAASCTRGVELNPNDADGYVFLAQAEAMRGEAQKALDLLDKAIALNAHPPAFYTGMRVMANFVGGHYEAAVAAARSIENAAMSTYRWHAAALALLGRTEEAHTVIETYLHRYPGFAIETHMEKMFFRRPEDAARYVEALRLAGAPTRAAAGATEPKPGSAAMASLSAD
ncbi:MAG: hypothetical protein FJX56_07965 [Alphaproteobacteria bacterium]|nr:hypothetical protein [Alphaproteobacteria bacterium]